MIENEAGAHETGYGNDLPDAFLEEMRVAILESRRPAARHITAIANDAAHRSRLVELLRTRAVERQFREAVSEYLDDAADRLESKIDAADTAVEFFDRALLPVAIASLLSGIGLLVTRGLEAAPIEITVGGIAGLTASGIGRTILRLGTVANKTAVKRLRRLGTRIRDLR